MEFTHDAVAKRQIIIILCLFGLICAGGAFFYQDDPAAIMRFAAGAALGCALNVVRVLMLKRAVVNALQREAHAATMHIKGAYLIRLLITAGVLLVAAFMHDRFVNLFGVVIAVLSFPIAMYGMYFFIKGKFDNFEAIIKTAPTDSASDAISEIAAIVEQGENKQNQQGALTQDDSPHELQLDLAQVESQTEAAPVTTTKLN